MVDINTKTPSARGIKREATTINTVDFKPYRLDIKHFQSVKSRNGPMQEAPKSRNKNILMDCLITTMPCVVY